VNDLVELIRPVSCRTMSIGQSRLNPDLAFTFGTTDSLLGLAQINKDPLVVFEVQHSKTGDVRGQMEERARLYLEEPRFEGPFRHSVKTVILVYYMQEDDESRKVYIRVSRVKVMDGKRVIITQVVDPSTRTGYLELSLSDFLPQDAIELGFGENEFGVRACDGVKIDIDITDALRHATGCEKGIQTLDDALPRMVQRRRVESIGIEE
jgi:hypothetical protein